MPLAKVILVSAATSALLIGVLVVIGWSYAQPHIAAVGSGPPYAEHPRGPWLTTPWGAGQGGCGRLDDDRIERHLAVADRWLVAELDLDPAQHAALAPVLGSAATWMLGLRDLCEAESDDARQTLALLSELTGKSDAAVKSIGTAFDGFYQSLDDSQRQIVDAWLTWPHRRGVR